MNAKLYLDYVESVVRMGSGHVRACVSSTGAPATAGLDANLRWPGYVGRAYPAAPLRILCAAQVHHGPHLAATAQTIQGVLAEIARKGASSERATRLAAAYEDAVPLWGPWIDFRKILAALKLDIDHPSCIAYTNVAKCWQTPGAANVEKPMKACVGAFPLDDLAKAIEANVILLMSADGTMQRTGVREGTVPLYNFGGRSSNAALSQIAAQISSRFSLAR